MHRRNLLQSILFGACASNPAAAQAAKAKDTRSTAAAPAGPFIQAGDGTSLFYKDWGTGKPVLFLAAWALNSDFWEHQMVYLVNQGLRCVAYDRRGHGRSAQPGQGYDFDTLAGDLDAVIQRLDLRDITLVGHSMGCGEVVRYLSRHGGAGRVARAILVSTISPFALKTPDNPDGGERSVYEKGRADLIKDRPGKLAEAGPAFFGAPKNPVSAELMGWWTRMMLQTSLKAMLDLHRVFTETDFRPEFRKIAVPTLLIHGDSDTSTPIEKTGRRAASLIPGSRLKVYEGAAHGLLITHMDRLSADILAFAKT